MSNRLKGKVEEIPARDLPGASRNMSVGAAVETEKAQLLNDQPTEIRKHRDASEILRELKAKGVFIEGTVESEERGEACVGLNLHQRAESVLLLRSSAISTE